MDHRGAAGLNADADSRTGILGGIVGDESHISRAVRPDKPIGQALLLDARADLAQHLGVRDADDRLGHHAAESRRQGDDDLAGADAPLGRAVLGDDQLFTLLGSRSGRQRSAAG
ncbi:hypothetical protein SDC9_124090 [bioreactor metagenome]|uniref:Uncharacterized protein n=1 Tax=bioreactor metagenome TaxID=1076179 RepID=A0A645CJF9_9ZZZZ